MSDHLSAASFVIMTALSENWPASIFTSKIGKQDLNKRFESFAESWAEIETMQELQMRTPSAAPKTQESQNL